MLDELVDVIETLKSRINEHRAVLQGNEAQTRLSLIDPLLRALGWDTADPALVRPEYHLGAGRADYVLLDSNEKELAIIEAKRLGERLSGQHREQAIVYAHRRGVRFPILTNGNDWEVYDQSDFVPNVSIEDRPLLNVSIADTDSAKCALQFLLLWRPNLASGQPIEASEPILGTVPPAPPATSAPSQTLVQNVPVPPDAGWITLKDFVAEPHTSPPNMRLPNGEQKQPTYWKDLLIGVAEWLIDDGALTADKCPVTTGHSSYLVNRLPKLHGDKDMKIHHILSNGLYLDTNAGAPLIVKKCNALLEKCGKDPAAVHVYDSTK